MIQIQCKIISENSTKSGPMCNFKELSFDDFVKWVYRVCDGCLEIKVEPNKSVTAIFDDRCEIYTLKENKEESNVYSK